MNLKKETKSITFKKASFKITHQIIFYNQMNQLQVKQSVSYYP